MVFGGYAICGVLEGIDLMGYGWPQLGDPILSQCDTDALRFVFSWAFAGTTPYPPAAALTCAAIVAQPEGAVRTINSTPRDRDSGNRCPSGATAT